MTLDAYKAYTMHIYKYMYTNTHTVLIPYTNTHTVLFPFHMNPHHVHSGWSSFIFTFSFDEFQMKFGWIYGNYAYSAMLYWRTPVALYQRSVANATTFTSPTAWERSFGKWERPSKEHHYFSLDVKPSSHYLIHSLYSHMTSEHTHMDRGRHENGRWKS